jgi:hypothetical protein
MDDLHVDLRAVGPMPGPIALEGPLGLVPGDRFHEEQRGACIDLEQSSEGLLGGDRLDYPPASEDVQSLFSPQDSVERAALQVGSKDRAREVRRQVVEHVHHESFVDPAEPLDGQALARGGEAEGVGRPPRKRFDLTPQHL